MSWAEQMSISKFCIIGKELRYAEVVFAGGLAVSSRKSEYYPSIRRAQRTTSVFC